MAKRVTPGEIVQMQQLYAKYGNFAAVGREMGRSASTVARYVKLKGTPPIVAHTFKEVVRGAQVFNTVYSEKLIFETSG